jgi:transcription antitermination factor NusA-like protein
MLRMKKVKSTAKMMEFFNKKGEIVLVPEKPAKFIMNQMGNIKHLNVLVTEENNVLFTYETDKGNGTMLLVGHLG